MHFDLADGAIFLFGTLIAVFLALVPLGKKQAEKRVAVLVTLVGIAVTTVFDLRLHIETAFDRQIPTIHSRDWRSVVDGIASYDQEANAHPRSKFEAIVNQPIREFILKGLNDASSGVIEVHSIPDVIRLTDQLIRASRDSILATSYIEPGQWWETNEGKEYQQGGQAAIHDGRRFRRIFIVDSDAELKRLSPIMRAQANAGTAVSYIFSDKLDPDERKDVIVIDTAVAGEIELDGSRRFKTAKFYTTSTRANDIRILFDKLRIQSKPFE